MACYKDVYAPTSRKYVSNEPQTRSFQKLNNKIFMSHIPAFIFKKLWCFHSNSAKANLSDTCVAACFRDTYAPTSRKYVSTEPKTRSFQYLNSKIFRSHSPVLIFKKLWYFHSNSAKTNLSDTCGGSFERHVCTEFQKICFY